MFNIKSKVKITELLLILFLVLFYQSSLAGNGYSISKYILANGGGEISGGNYKVNSSIAQVITASSNKDDYSVNSGFWQPSTNTDIIFKTNFEQ